MWHAPVATDYQRQFDICLMLFSYDLDSSIEIHTVTCTQREIEKVQLAHERKKTKHTHIYIYITNTITLQDRRSVGERKKFQAAKWRMGDRIHMEMK